VQLGRDDEVEEGLSVGPSQWEGVISHWFGHEKRTKCRSQERKCLVQLSASSIQICYEALPSKGTILGVKRRFDRVSAPDQHGTHLRNAVLVLFQCDFDKRFFCAKL